MSDPTAKEIKDLGAYLTLAAHAVEERDFLQAQITTLQSQTQRAWELRSMVDYVGAVDSFFARLGMPSILGPRFKGLEAGSGDPKD